GHRQRLPFQRLQLPRREFARARGDRARRPHLRARRLSGSHTMTSSIRVRSASAAGRHDLHRVRASGRLGAPVSTLSLVAKKAKTPRAPRTPATVQAPKKRVDTRKGGGLGSFPRWIWAVVAAAVVGVAAVAAFAFGGSSSGTSDSAVAKAMAA